MIKIEHLHLPFAISQLSCQFKPKRLIGVLGANGSGKSSLLKAIAGIYRPQNGHIAIDGNDSQTLSFQRRSQLMAYLAQDVRVHWPLDVYEVIALGALVNMPSKDERLAVERVANQCRVEHLLKRPYDSLSGGERARVQLARCLIKDAPILLADEPLAALDPYYQLEMMQLFKTFSKDKTCVVVLHHLALAYQFCDDIVLLKEGKLVAAGEALEVLNEKNLATAFHITAELNRAERKLANIEQLTNAVK